MAMAMKNGNGKAAEIAAAVRQAIRCAVYTRKSTDEGLQQEFNSLDAQREAGEAFILSQRHEGWQLLPAHYDDGGYTVMRHIVSPRTSHAISPASSQIGDRTNDGCGIGYLLV
jgi:hypothetical protein